jgi:diguanylate cyclase (GGDEF)-like protein
VIISITSCTILLSGWWIGQRYSQAVTDNQIARADYFLNAYLKSEEALHTTAVKGIITDFGFRRTVADGDPDTIASMLDNHAQRVGLDLLLITDRQGNGLSSFGGQIDENEIHRLYALLEKNPEKPHILALEKGYYWLYLSAIKAPHIVGYAIAGSAIDINKLEHIQSITGLDLTLHSASEGYYLTTNSQLIQQLDPQTSETLLPSPWQRQRFLNKEVTVPALPEDDVTLLMSADLSAFHQQFDRFSIVMLSVTAVLVSLITLFSLFFSRRLFMPMESLHKKLLHRASYDNLTELQNRITALEQLYRHHAEARRSGQAYFVALLDIDHFKTINDSYGHSAGDRVLAEVARRLKTCLREYDVLGRYGGEEFLVAASLSFEDCQNHLLRLKNKISEQQFHFKDREIALTISIGACFVDYATLSSELTPETLVEYADQALYEAKAQGRNQIVIKSREPDSILTSIVH